jgi:pimeloyl-ACP methyl ester carboxylesterase
MNKSNLAGAVLALSLLAPAIRVSAAAPQTFEAGALQVEQVSERGPVLIFIPGLASGSWAWRDSATRLADTHAVYLLTLPGFDGRTAVAGTTLDSLAADLRTLIESRKLERPVLVGHSLGATLSLSFATEHSALIAGVVAVDGLPVFPGTERMVGARGPLAEQTRAQFAGLNREQFEASQQTYMRSVGVIDTAMADRLAKLASRSDVGATADFAAQVLLLDLRPKLASIRVPVVAVSPFHAPDLAAMGIDEAGKTQYYRFLLQGVEKLDVVSISPARHFVMFDQPEKFAEALDGALAKMLP